MWNGADDRNMMMAESFLRALRAGVEFLERV